MKKFFWVKTGDAAREKPAKHVAKRSDDAPREKPAKPVAKRSDDDTRPTRLSSHPPPPMPSALVTPPPKVESTPVMPPAPRPAPKPPTEPASPELGTSVQIACLSCAAKNRVPVGRLADRSRCARCQQNLTPIVGSIALESEAILEALFDARVPVLFALGAAWSGPWTLLATELERLAEECAGRVIIARIDVDHRPNLARQLAAESVPTLVLVRDGQEIDREHGVLPAQTLRRRFGI
ncbi:MAG: thioredoxin domain-containing protein [Polyangiales bacterium]